jgi:putative tryptophan/tyrosine transport system substrate-binding protein
MRRREFITLLGGSATGPLAARAQQRLLRIGYLSLTTASASLADPGGNVTGSTFFFPELMAKRLELLKQVVPSTARVGALLIRDNASNGNVLEVMEATAMPLGIGLQPIEVRGPTEFESAFFGLGRQASRRAGDLGSRKSPRQPRCNRSTRHKAPPSCGRRPGISRE